MANKKPLLIAIIFGIVAVVLVFVYMKSMEDKYAQKETEYGTVVVAAQTIQVRERIKDGMVKEVEWPMDRLPKNAYTELDEVLQKISTQVLYEGIPLFPDQFKAVEQVEDLAVHLKENERAVTVGVTEIVAVGGNVRTGDHVDILATFQDNEEVGAPTTITILRNIRVAAIGTDIGRASENTNGKGISKSVTLAVSPNEAEILTLVDENADIRLSLRPLDEVFAPPSFGVTVTDIVRYRPTREDMKDEAEKADEERRRREDEYRQLMLQQGKIPQDSNGDQMALPPFPFDFPTGPEDVQVEVIRGGETEIVSVPESLYANGYSVWPMYGHRFDSMHPMPWRGQ